MSFPRQQLPHLLVTALVWAVTLGLSMPLAVAAHADPALPPSAARVDQRSGIGDPYFPAAGNPGYDVRHYGIDVRYNPATGRLTGDTTLRLTPRVRLRRFNLDLLLHVHRVTVNGRRASFHQSRHELTIRPRRALPRGASAAVEVTYHGRPARIRYAGERPFVATSTGAIAVGQPHIAAWWFPSNDHPRDKANFDLRLTVPKGYQGVSNGALVDHHRVKRGREWHWAVSSPMATYLAFAAFGKYDLERGTTRHGLPYVNAFEHGLGRFARPARVSLHSSARIIDWLAARWGRYPFSELGGVVPDVDLGYALETQTRPVYGRDMFRYGPSRSLVVHELAHQWFGDRVSLRRWRDIWLNEGLATYAEWMWQAHAKPGSTQKRFLRLYRLFEPTNGFWSVRIGDPGPKHLFDDAVYERGAMTAQALRNRVGSSDFFRIMRRWTHGDRGVGSTAALRRLAEHESGRQLDGLFYAWLYSGEKPERTAANGF